MVKSGAVVRGTLDLVLMGVLALGLAALTGCGSSASGGGGGGTAPTGALASGGATIAYAVQGYEETDESVVGLAIGGSGSVASTSTLALPSALIVGAVATDSSGQIYVGGDLVPGFEILVYAAGATGTATPVRTITLNALNNVFFDPMSMQVDASGNLYVLSSSGSVAVFGPTANGAATPTQLLSTSGLIQLFSMAIDGTGKIYLSGATDTNGEILVYAAGATGGAAPAQTILSPAFTSTSTSETLTVFWGLGLDASNNLYAVLDTENLDSSGDVTSESAEVQEFAEGATGQATPVKTIGGSDTGITFGAGLRLDKAGNFYLANESDSGGTVVASLLGFGPNASGNVAPGLKLSSSTLTSPAPEIAVQ